MLHLNDYPFEPAIILKVAVHLHTIKQVRDDPAVTPPVTSIPCYAPPRSDTSCPTSAVLLRGQIRAGLAPSSHQTFLPLVQR